ncbi:MAG: hypothetical protein Q8L48_24950 [Archangium sp.]|nr:hypothetical protein [Archangium sp.]
MDSTRPLAEDCLIAAKDASLAGRVVWPADPPGGAVVLGLLGTDSRFTSRNNFLATSLARAGLAVLVVELLTEDEDARLDLAHPDLPLLAERLCLAADWIAARGGLAIDGVGLLGVGEVGAAALVAAAARPELARAVVCAATPLELAGSSALLTASPTLVLVGDGDQRSLLGSRLVSSMRCEHRVEVICGAGPRLVEPGALDRVVNLAAPWLLSRLRPASPREAGRSTSPPTAAASSPLRTP